MVRGFFLFLEAAVVTALVRVLEVVLMKASSTFLVVELDTSIYPLSRRVLKTCCVVCCD